MFRSVTRIPFRRWLHTPPPRPPPGQGNNFPLVFGIAGVVAAVTYLASPRGQRIALDTQPVAGMCFFFHYLGKCTIIFVLSAHKAELLPPRMSTKFPTDLPLQPELQNHNYQNRLSIHPQYQKAVKPQKGMQKETSPPREHSILSLVK
jgi:hypothetical protein